MKNRKTKKGATYLKKLFIIKIFFITSDNTAYPATLWQNANLFLTLFNMSESKWEKFKMKEKYRYISIDEIIIFIIGFLVFSFQYLHVYRLYFVGLVILWYWLKIKHAETNVHKMNQKIYNVYYEKCRPVAQKFIDGETEQARKPLNYELDQLEYKRKCLVDKFVVINLILVILIQLFIKS